MHAWIELFCTAADYLLEKFIPVAVTFNDGDEGRRNGYEGGTWVGWVGAGGGGQGEEMVTACTWIQTFHLLL